MLVSSMGLVTLTTGCATITGGTTEKLSVKTQKDSIDLAGATCVLTNSEGSYQVVTPGKVSVHRAKDDLNVQCTKDGEAPAVTSIKSSGRGGATVGDFIMFGLVGGPIAHGIDKATGAAYVYPDDITVSFGKPADQPLPQDITAPHAETDSTASIKISAPTLAH
ncbi:hypothetical protein DID96_19260 [Burkholderia sp. Bp8963]|uniref:hypothetical protein n=1 Tax=Burkholderia sp. Bp8963 TaxID=2184547 RepID=UPI000F5A4491|nr:hypothetical protein [Burkholderia sp. Bp8963]RQS68723.1 hypothetical protein DID96_19260 [Burkholderia sp. Bp8963]